MTAAPVSKPVKWTLFGDTRDLVQRVAALQSANAALEARLAAQEAKMAAMQADLSTMRASEATACAAATPRPAVAFKAATPQRFTGQLSILPHLEEWLFNVKNYALHVGMPEDQRVLFAQQFLSGDALQWWSRASQRQAAWTWEEFAAEMTRGRPKLFHTF